MTRKQQNDHQFVYRRVQLVKKVSFDHKLQAPVYTVNYEGIFQTF